MAHVSPDAGQRRRIVAHLNAYWFDAAAPKPFFPTEPVARIYAEGVLETLDLSLKGKPTVPIEAWWVLDSAEFRMLNLADVKDGVTVGRSVTLLIMTPRPGNGGRATPPPLLRDLAEAHRTHPPGPTPPTQP